MSEPITAEAMKNVQEAGPSLLSLDPGLMIWTTITFVLLLLVLRKYAWTPILNSLKSREERVSEAMKRIEEADASMKRVATEQQRILDLAKEESSQIVTEARKAAEAIRAQMVESARLEKEKILESARREIDTAKQGAEAQLRKVAADLAIGAAEKLLVVKFDAEADRKLVERSIAELHS